MKSSSKCAMLSVAVLLAASPMSAPASAQADEDKGLSSGALAVLLFSSKAKPHIKARPKTSKCTGFDCSELTQWTMHQSASKKSGLPMGMGNPRLKAVPIRR
jgi:hypothetical protein